MESAVEKLIERQKIEDTVVRLFVSTDRRDWASVKACLADEVTLDMTSLAGGEPLRLTAADVAATWEKSLKPIDQVHHQVGNFDVRIDGNEANVSCYGVAYHYRRIESPERTRTFVGSYDVHLMHAGSAWRIDVFRFRLKFLDGNERLEAAH